MFSIFLGCGILNSPVDPPYQAESPTVLKGIKRAIKFCEMSSVDVDCGGGIDVNITVISASIVSNIVERSIDI